jgi:hypothetical protein
VKALVLILITTLSITVHASERVDFGYWSVLKHDHKDNSPFYATSVGFDVDGEQRIWFTCSYGSDGFQAEFLKLKMTEYGQDIHTYVEYSDGHEQRKFYIAPSDIGTDLFATISNLRFLDAVENWKTMSLKYTIWKDRKIKSVSSRKVDLKGYNKARDAAISFCNQE